MMPLTLDGVAAVTGRPERGSSADFFEEPAPPGDVAMVRVLMKKKFSHEIWASVWNWCTSSIVIKLESCSNSYSGEGDHRAKYKLTPYCFNDRLPLLEASSRLVCSCVLWLLLARPLLTVPQCDHYGTCRTNYPFLPAPPGRVPPCAKPGSTFCEKLDHYPTRPGWRVGIALAFYAQGCGFDPGPGRWHLSVLKCDRLMSVDLLRSPRKSIRRANSDLGILKSTDQNIVHKRLRLRAYKIQFVQNLQRNDKPRRTEYANAVLSRIDDNGFLNHVTFSDKATFHTCGKVHRHNCRVWGEENPRVVMEYERDSPKVNVRCALTCDPVIGPFFFVESTVTGTTYLDMLENYAVPQIQDEFFFRQDGAPPHYANQIRDYLNTRFPNKWIGRSGSIEWPPRSPHLTPLDFFLWEYVKSIVYRTPVQDLADFRRRIVDACASVTPVMLRNTWREIEYRLDIVRATRGAHVEIY
ncbi:hypothetical protein ANN_01038 [Periplaneta americana]|uniref:Uncharacterized protein n=1 Tax=Periplaneta americana TaxID=6978 RepID=A0ABQ8TSG7_PERAM|nr:hypothetical protein ANN_01038 [Periplaneta americana]